MFPETLTFHAPLCYIQNIKSAFFLTNKKRSNLINQLNKKKGNESYGNGGENYVAPLI